MGAGNSETVFAGLRSVQRQGNSLVIATPKRELRDELGVDVEEIDGECVRVSMDADGNLSADLSSLLD